MIIEAEIAKALMGRLATLPESPLPAIAWPNLNFEPTIGTPYLQPSFLRVPTEQPGIPNDSYRRFSGILQVSVFWPRNQGIVAPTELAGKVAEHFARGTRMPVTDDSPAETVFNVEIGPQPPTVNTPLGEDAWHHQPVSIPFFALV